MATRASFLHPALGLIGLISLLASGPTVAAGRTLCCINEQGRNACGDILPRECYGRAYREVSERGVTLRYVAAPLSAEQLAQRAIDLERKKQADLAAREEQRRNEALLNTYTTEKDIDNAHQRAAAEMNKVTLEIETKLADLQKRKRQLDNEMEFYLKHAPPDKLQAQMRTTEGELKTTQQLIDSRKKEMAALDARFEDKRQRFRILKRGGLRRSVLEQPLATPAPR